MLCLVYVDHEARDARTSIDCHENYQRVVAPLLFAFRQPCHASRTGFVEKTINTAARFLAFLITFSLIDTSPCISGSLCPHSPSSYPVFHTNCFLRIGSFTPSLSSFLPLYVPLFLCVYHSLSLCLSLFLSFIFFHSHFCPCLFRR